MSEFQQATPHVKKNIFLIRFLMAMIIFCFLYFYYQDHPADTPLISGYAGLLVGSFIPFLFLPEVQFEKMRLQHLVFLMDSVFLIGAVSLFDHAETNLLIIIFFTFFISAMSQSVGRALVVAGAVIGLYIYLFLKTENVNIMDPVLLLSCALLLVVSIHSGYLAYRTVQEDREIMELAKKANLLSEKLREGDQMAMEYASSLKNVLDTMPIGAIAVSINNSIIFVNARVGKILGMNPRDILYFNLLNENSPLGLIGDRMAKALIDRQELKREFLDMDWKGVPKTYRLDSAAGIGPGGKAWGTLFLVQEFARNTEGEPVPAQT